MGEKEDFISEYIERGFGKVKAADLETMIFHHILRDERYGGMTDGELSHALRVPITKIKTLRYNDALLYSTGDPKTAIAEILVRNFQNTEGEKWQIVVDSKYHRDIIVERLQKEYHPVDFKNNRTILLLDEKGFSALLKYAAGKTIEEMAETLEIPSEKKKDLWRKVQARIKEIGNDVTVGVISEAVKSLAIGLII